MNIGFTIGKFAPLHLGHDELIKRGIKENDLFYILINDTDIIRVSLEDRAKWLKKLYPDAKIILGTNPPKQYGMDDESIKIQIDYLKKVFKDVPINRFYSGEDYGYYVSKYMDVDFIKVDKNIPINATIIRSDLEANKKYLDNSIYKELKKKRFS